MSVSLSGQSSSDRQAEIMWNAVRFCRHTGLLICRPFNKRKQCQVLDLKCVVTFTWHSSSGWHTGFKLNIFSTYLPLLSWAHIIKAVPSLYRLSHCLMICTPALMPSSITLMYTRWVGMIKVNIYNDRWEWICCVDFQFSIYLTGIFYFILYVKLCNSEVWVHVLHSMMAQVSTGILVIQ